MGADLIRFEVKDSPYGRRRGLQKIGGFDQRGKNRGSLTLFEMTDISCAFEVSGEGKPPALGMQLLTKWATLRLRSPSVGFKALYRKRKQL